MNIQFWERYHTYSAGFLAKIGLICFSGLCSRALSECNIEPPPGARTLATKKSVWTLAESEYVTMSVYDFVTNDWIQQTLWPTIDVVLLSHEQLKSLMINLSCISFYKDCPLNSLPVWIAWVHKGFPRKGSGQPKIEPLNCNI